MPDNLHIVYVDTLISYKFAKKNNKTNNIIFITDNPLLANTATIKNSIEDISLLLTQSEAKKLNYIILELLEGLEEDSFKYEFYKRYGLINKRLSLLITVRGFVTSLVHKAKMIEKFISKKNIKKIDIYTVKSERNNLSNPYNFPRFISPIVYLAEEGFFQNIDYNVFYIDHNLPKSFNDTRTSNIILKIVTWPVANIFFNLFKKIPVLLGKKQIHYAKSCEPLIETLPWLLSKGYSVTNIKIPGYIVRKTDTDREDISWLDKNLAKKMEFYLSKIFTNVAISLSIKNIILNRLSFGLRTSQDTESVLKNYFANKLQKTKILLTSGVHGVIAMQVHQICRDMGIKLIYFEHGVTTGIASFASRYINYSDAASCDYLFVCSKKSKEAFSKINKKYNKPKISIIGEAKQKKSLFYPIIQKHIVRNKLSIDSRKETIYHVSSLLYPGNVRASYDSPVESHVYKFEVGLLQDVYRYIPKNILFKKYPTRRMAYQPCYSEILELSSNIHMMNEEDFRYTRSIADLIVTDSTQSALAWCLSINKPLIHLISKNCHSLLPSVIKKFNDSFISIDLDKNNWVMTLKEKLLAPREEIINEWKSKSEVRQKIIEEYIYGPKGSAGVNAARLISNYENNLR